MVLSTRDHPYAAQVEHHPIDNSERLVELVRDPTSQQLFR